MQLSLLLLWLLLLLFLLFLLFVVVVIGMDVPREDPSKNIALSSHLCNFPMRPTSPTPITACINAYTRASAFVYVDQQ